MGDGTRLALHFLVRHATFWVQALLVTAFGCESSVGWNPGPSAAAVDYSANIRPPPSALLILIADDRPTEKAAHLRSGVGVAIRRLGWDLVGDYRARSSDAAAWHPADIRVILAPPSAVSTESIASPTNDAALAWTTIQATQDGANALAAAVDGHVLAESAPLEAPFHPLERARHVGELMAALRPPLDDREAQLVAIASARTWGAIGISIVAASDDESPDAPESYVINAPSGGPSIVAGIVTPESDRSGKVDAMAYPRLAAWSEGRLWAPVDGCYDGLDAPFVLFSELCTDYGGYRCDGRPIRQRSLGLGDCNIEVTTLEPNTCASNRGWDDPMDTDGVRRSRTTITGARVCEVQPVDPSVMDLCVHDPTCAGCGSGWCITQINNAMNLCAPGSMPRSIRFVGGALPDRGSVHVVCREDI
jgi:hypothetical protein